MHILYEAFHADYFSVNAFGGAFNTTKNCFHIERWKLDSWFDAYV